MAQSCFVALLTSAQFEGHARALSLRAAHISSGIVFVMAGWTGTRCENTLAHTHRLQTPPTLIRNHDRDGRQVDNTIFLVLRHPHPAILNFRFPLYPILQC